MQKAKKINRRRCDGAASTPATVQLGPVLAPADPGAPGEKVCDKLRTFRVRIIDDPIWSDSDNEGPDECIGEWYVLCPTAEDGYDHLVQTLNEIAADAASRYAAGLRVAAGAGTSSGQAESGPTVQKGMSRK